MVKCSRFFFPGYFFLTFGDLNSFLGPRTPSDIRKKHRGVGMTLCGQGFNFSSERN